MTEVQPKVGLRSIGNSLQQSRKDQQHLVSDDNTIVEKQVGKESSRGVLDVGVQSPLPNSNAMASREQDKLDLNRLQSLMKYLSPKNKPVQSTSAERKFDFRQESPRLVTTDSEDSMQSQQSLQIAHPPEPVETQVDLKPLKRLIQLLSPTEASPKATSPTHQTPAVSSKIENEQAYDVFREIVNLVSPSSEHVPASRQLSHDKAAPTEQTATRMAAEPIQTQTFHFQETESEVATPIPDEKLTKQPAAKEERDWQNVLLAICQDAIDAAKDWRLILNASNEQAVQTAKQCRSILKTSQEEAFRAAKNWRPLLSKAQTSAQDMAQDMKQNVKRHPASWSVVAIIGSLILVMTLFFGKSVGTTSMKWWQFHVQVHPQHVTMDTSDAMDPAAIVERVGRLIQQKLPDGEADRIIAEAVKRYSG